MGRFDWIFFFPDYLRKQDSSSEISTVNDSCYNSLVADLRGNCSLCYLRSMEPLDITKEVSM